MPKGNVSSKSSPKTNKLSLVGKNTTALATSSVKSAFKYRPKSYTPVLATLLVIAAFLLGILLTKVQYLEKGTTVNVGAESTGTDAQVGTQPVPGAKVDVGVGHFPAQGDKDAKVKIVEFADFRCPFCEQLYTQSEKQIISDYVNSGKAAFYFRHFAFLGDPSVVAANAAECANEQGKFWAMHNWFYDNQPPESDTSIFTVDNLTSVAGNLGMDTTSFRSCLSSSKYQKDVDKDMSEGQTAGVSGTPTLFINGVSIVGAVPYATIKAEIDKALSE